MQNEKNKKGEESYSSDRPITRREEDRFDRWPFSERITSTIGDRKDPSSLVIGIYGVWGDGKTSVLNLMEEAFKAYGDIILIRFNPWLFESEAQLLKGFFETLADALGKSLTTKVEELGESLRKYGHLLSVALPGASLQALGEELSSVKLDELRERIEHILSESKRRVVVLIDDIDRLDRQEVHAILKLVKLSAGFKNTVYILAFDDEMVASAIGEKYGTGGVGAGRSFLEKIVQVALHLPPADQLALRRLTLEGVDASVRQSGIELSEEQAQEFVYHFGDGLEIRLTTPRQAKRYANALAFALPLLRGEVHPVDQMLIEGIRVFYPKLYTVIRENPDVFLGKSYDGSLEDKDRKRQADMLDKGLEQLDSVERGAAKELLETLFPRLKKMTYGAGWDERWEREKRIASREYFHRYFQYAVPARDVADQSLERFLETVETADESSVSEAFKHLVSRGAAGRVIDKLRLREDSMNAPAAKRLALAIAWNSSILPREKVFFDFTATFNQVVVLVKKLILRVPKGPERDALTRGLVTDGESLSFAIECFRRIRKTKDEPEDGRIVSVDMEQELGEIVADRIRSLAEKQPPYLAWPKDSNLFFWIWNEHGQPGEVATYLTNRFESHRQEIPAFLGTYVATAWPAKGVPHKSDFKRSSYDSVSQLIDPEIILGHLKVLYGSGIEASEYYSDRELPFEERVAHQFAFIHRGVKESTASSEQKSVESAE